MALSIGLEFEAIVISKSNGAPLPAASRTQLDFIAASLTAAGLSAHSWVPHSTRTDPPYGSWLVMTDATISEVTSQSDSSESAFQSRFGVELVSPIFFNAPSGGWQIEVEKVLLAVPKEVVWKANRSTGLHVHVGRGNDQFTLAEVKRIAMLVIRFEDAIDGLHPSHRVFSNDNILSNRNNDALKDLPLTEIYSAIQAAADIEKVVKLLNYVPPTRHVGDKYDGFGDAKFFKVNFTSLYKHSTIEFRQHEGTVAAPSAIAWTNFIISFANFALTSTEATIMAGGNTLEDLKAIVPMQN